MQARHLACREDDDRAFALQVLQNGFELARTAARPEHGHRQQQALERLQLRQQAIGHNLHIAADTAHHVQQGQPIERANRVVGNDDHAPVCGNTFALVVAHGIAEGEVRQHLLHKLKAFQMRVLLGKAAKVLLPEQAAQHAAHSNAQPWVPLQLRQMHVNDVID